MPTNHTPNYALNQWERDDRILMDDFNADNAKIDAAIRAEADARAAGDATLRTALNAKGNCQIWVTTYKGTGMHGKDSPNSITFPWMPSIVFVVEKNMAVFIPGVRQVNPHGNVLGVLEVTWDGTTLSWYSITGASEQFNSGKSYSVIAFMPI
jgi:hypothetical protein